MAGTNADLGTVNKPVLHGRDSQLKINFNKDIKIEQSNPNKQNLMTFAHSQMQSPKDNKTSTDQNGVNTINMNSPKFLNEKNNNMN